jgi:cobalamin biosynthesis Mg chelatase CobN
MSKKYQEIGVAVVDGSLLGVETTLVVQLFGSETRAVAGKKTTSSSKQTGSQAAGSSTKKLGLQMSGASLKVTGQSGEIVANSEGKFREPINPFSVNKILVSLLVGIIIGTFVFDLVLVSKKTPRLSSRSFAQLLFLGFILLIIVISKQGVII